MERQRGLIWYVSLVVYGMEHSRIDKSLYLNCRLNTLASNWMALLSQITGMWELYHGFLPLTLARFYDCINYVLQMGPIIWIKVRKTSNHSRRCLQEKLHDCA